jgi:NAD-dependent dihydropyrimidine dehydrogenase PreA subunit
MKIEVNPEKCSGCMSCQLACSFTYEGVFNPLKSRIAISWPGELEYKISFTEDCTDCGVCVQYCNYGALKIEED